jgi:pre-rRNA-processing protein TSR4
MPQLLYYLKVDKVGEDSLDWGTLVVYTCPASCTPKEGSGYVEEFIWRQNFTLERTRLK